jgi:putative solute:sodium symporter small subunit
MVTADKNDLRRRVDEYHKKNVLYIIILLIIWFIVSLGGILAVKTLNEFTFLGFPFGYYLGSQISIIVFIIEIFVYAKLMDNLDKKYGFYED